MRAETLNLLSELKNTELFCNLERPSNLPRKIQVSWKEALEFCPSEKWSALQLMTKNRHAGKVNQLNWNRGQQWNPICAILRPEILLITESAIQRIGSIRKMTDDFRNSVAWDLLAILIEKEFEDVTSPFFALPKLYPIYQKGHFPCGWTGIELDTNWSSSDTPIPDEQILIC